MVTIEDLYGNVETTDDSDIELMVGMGPGSLGGTVKAQAIDGVATFNDLLLNTVGTYTLSASDISDGIGGFDSNSFDVAMLPTAPVVTLNPLSQSVTVGTDVRFVAAASGIPSPTVLWEISTDGGSTFTPINGATSATLDIGAATLAENDDQYEAVFSNGIGSPATTTPATLTVNPATAAPVVTTNPLSQTLTAGQDVKFTAAASGSPTPTVLWMIEASGASTFTPISGATSTTLDLGPATLAESGNRYEAVFHNGSGPDATTTAATLIVNPARRPQLLPKIRRAKQLPLART